MIAIGSPLTMLIVLNDLLEKEILCIRHLADKALLVEEARRMQLLVVNETVIVGDP